MFSQAAADVITCRKARFRRTVVCAPFVTDRTWRTAKLDDVVDFRLQPPLWQTAYLLVAPLVTPPPPCVVPAVQIASLDGSFRARSPLPEAVDEGGALYSGGAAGLEVSASLEPVADSQSNGEAVPALGDLPPPPSDDETSFTSSDECSGELRAAEPSGGAPVAGLEFSPHPSGSDPERVQLRTSGEAASEGGRFARSEDEALDSSSEEGEPDAAHGECDLDGEEEGTAQYFFELVEAAQEPREDDLAPDGEDVEFVDATGGDVDPLPAAAASSAELLLLVNGDEPAACKLFAMKGHSSLKAGALRWQRVGPV